MKSLKSAFLSLAILILVFLLWFYRFEVADFFQGAGGDDELTALKLENESLKFELSRLGKDSTIPVGEGYLAADVYSSYPFNDQAKLIVNKGTADGVREGMPVLATSGIFLGKVAAVQKNLSEVQTIFDPAWRSSVGIGPQKTKALLVGANSPWLDLIAKEAAPAINDEVINLSPEYPYGLLVGRVSEVNDDLSEPWVSAEIKPVFNPNALNKVLILIDGND